MAAAHQRAPAAACQPPRFAREAPDARPQRVGAISRVGNPAEQDLGDLALAGAGGERVMDAKREQVSRHPDVGSDQRSQEPTMANENMLEGMRRRL